MAGTDLYTVKCPNCSQTANVEERISSYGLTIDCPSCGYYKYRDGHFPENNKERIPNPINVPLTPLTIGDLTPPWFKSSS